MEKTKEMVEMYAELVAAQSEFPPIPMDKTANAGKFTYKYASLQSIIDAIRPILNKHGFFLAQYVDVKFSGDRPEISVVTDLIHKSGNSMHSVGYSCLSGGYDPQSLGSATTYAKRYDLCAILGIVADEDEDGKIATDAHTKPGTARQAAPVPEPPADEYIEINGIKRYNKSRKTLNDVYQESHGLITTAQFREISKLIETKIGNRKDVFARWVEGVYGCRFYDIEAKNFTNIVESLKNNPDKIIGYKNVQPNNF